MSEELWFPGDDAQLNGGLLKCGLSLEFSISKVVNSPSFLIDQLEYLSRMILKEKNKKKRCHFLFLRGQIYAEHLNRREEALVDFSKCLDNNGRDVCCAKHLSLMYDARGMIFLNTGRTSKAFDDFKDALRVKPGNTRAYFNFSRALLVLGREKEAEASLLQYVRRIDEIKGGHNIVLLLNQMGELYKKCGKFEEAIKYYSHCSQLVDDCGCPKEERGFCYFQLGEFEKCLKDLNHGCSCGYTQYSEMEILLMKFRCHMRKKERDDSFAYSILQIAKEKVSGKCGPNERGRCNHCRRNSVMQGFIEYHKIRGEIEKAIRYCDELGKSYPEPWCHFVGELEKGNMYYELGEFDLALPFFIKASEYDCELAMTRAAEIYGKKGKHAKSAKYRIKVKTTKEYKTDYNGMCKAELELMIAGSFLAVKRITPALICLERATKILEENGNVTDISALSSQTHNISISENEKILLEMMKRISEFTSFAKKSKKCSYCGEDAKKKCSACKMFWYCCVDHQKKDWKDHKKVCGNN